MAGFFFALQTHKVFLFFFRAISMCSLKSTVFSNRPFFDTLAYLSWVRVQNFILFFLSPLLILHDRDVDICFIRLPCRWALHGSQRWHNFLFFYTRGTVTQNTFQCSSCASSSFFYTFLCLCVCFGWCTKRSPPSTGNPEYNILF